MAMPGKSATAGPSVKTDPSEPSLLNRRPATVQAPLFSCIHTTSAPPAGAITTSGLIDSMPGRDRVRRAPSVPEAVTRLPSTWLLSFCQTTAESPLSSAATSGQLASPEVSGDSVLTGPIAPPRCLILACTWKMPSVPPVLQADQTRSDWPCRDTARTGQSCPCQPAPESVTTGVQLASAGGAIIRHALSTPASAAAVRIRCHPRIRVRMPALPTVDAAAQDK